MPRASRVRYCWRGIGLALLACMLLGAPTTAAALEVFARCCSDHPSCGPLPPPELDPGGWVHVDVFLSNRPPLHLRELLEPLLLTPKAGTASPGHGGVAPEDEPALVELSSQFLAKAKMISMILDPAVNGFMEPVISTTTELIGNAMLGTTLNEVVANAENEVPPDVARLLASDLQQHLASELPKHLPPLLIASLADALVADLGPRITSRLDRLMNPELAAELERLLRERVPQTLSSDGKPQQPAGGGDSEIGLRRAVFNRLTPRLGEALRDALVETLGNTDAHTIRGIRVAESSDVPPHARRPHYPPPQSP